MLEQTNKQNYKFERSYMSIFMTKSKNLSGSYHISLMKAWDVKINIVQKKTSLNLCKREIFFPNQYLYCNVVNSCSWLVAREQQNAEGSLKLSAFMMPYSLYKNIVIKILFLWMFGQQLRTTLAKHATFWYHHWQRKK